MTRMAAGALFVLGIFLALFGIAAQGDIGPKVALIVLGMAAIFGAGLLDLLLHRSERK